MWRSMRRRRMGFYVTAYIYVEPKFIDPPVVKTMKVLAPAQGKVAVDYEMDLGGREDQSVITWYTCDDASGANPMKVAVSRGNMPLKAYVLMPGDVGRFLRVSVEPKHAISEAGPAVFAMGTTAIAASDIPSSTVSPDFRNFVETATNGPVAGRWTVIGGWTVVAQENLTNGYGVRAGGAAGGAGARGAASGGAGARGGPAGGGGTPSGSSISRMEKPATWRWNW